MFKVFGKAKVVIFINEYQVALWDLNQHRILGFFEMPRSCYNEDYFQRQINYDEEEDITYVIT